MKTTVNRMTAIVAAAFGLSLGTAVLAGETETPKADCAAMQGTEKESCMQHMKKAEKKHAATKKQAAAKTGSSEGTSESSTDTMSSANSSAVDRSNQSWDPHTNEWIEPGSQP